MIHQDPRRLWPLALRQKYWLRPSASPRLSMTAMGSSTEHRAALAALGLNTKPRSRQDLARLVARCHPASQPWSAVQTAAYRRVWEELESGCEADVPVAA